jgi:alanine racemase
LASKCDQLYGLGVASLEEGQELREQVGELGRKRLPIIVFSGAAPWSDEKGLFCERYQLTPILTNEEDFRKFIAQGWAKRVPYELKFNTGMNRLGLAFESIQRVRKVLGELPAEERPQGILSHLAVAEEPDHNLTLKQVERFQVLRTELHSITPASQFHLGNSAAIWNARALRLAELTDIVRPGLALYGVTPWSGAPARGIAPVLRYTAEVIQLHTLKPGEVMGYGAHYRVPPQAQQGVRVAVLNCGYADGLPRLLRGQGAQPGGFTWLGGREARFLGVISMDLCAVECSESVRVGDRAEILGPQVDAWSQARVAQTIPYELYTSISPRVRRREGP